MAKEVTDEYGSVDIDNGFVADKDAPVITWTTRRRMAFICLYAFIVGTLIMFGLSSQAMSDRQLEFLETVYSYFAMGTMSVILAYFGFTTLPFIGRGRNTNG